MKRDRYNITIYKGETFGLQVELKDSTNAAIDLTGSTITSQCRDKSTNAVLFSFSCTTTATPNDGKLFLGLTANNSASLTPQKNASYDVKIQWSNGTVKKYLSGDVKVIDTITP
ncbi:MAG: hypothetical protein ACKODS_05235 [Methylophilaceae bacterium]